MPSRFIAWTRWSRSFPASATPTCPPQETTADIRYACVCVCAVYICVCALRCMSSCFFNVASLCLCVFVHLCFCAFGFWRLLLLSFCVYSVACGLLAYPFYFDRVVVLENLGNDILLSLPCCGVNSDRVRQDSMRVCNTFSFVQDLHKSLVTCLHWNIMFRKIFAKTPISTFVHQSDDCHTSTLVLLPSSTSAFCHRVWLRWIRVET